MTLPSGNKIVKASFDASINKIRITTDRWVFDSTVPDPLEVDNLTVNVAADITSLAADTAVIDDLTATTFKLLEPGGPDFITLLAPALTSSYTLTFPADDGDANQVLTTDGAGNLSWEDPPSSGAPTNATYVVVSLDATLTDERRLQTEATVLTLTDGGAGADLTIAVAANGITDAKLRQGGALTVIGRSANSTGNVADIAAGANDRVLSRASDALAFTQVSTAMVADNAITDAKLRDSGALSVIGRSANSSGDPADISAGANDRVLSREANALAFTQVSTGMVADDAVTDAKLRESAALSVIGRATNSTGNPADIAAGADDRVLSRAGSALAFTQVSTGMVADDAVTDAKIRESGACSVIGRSANSTGNPADISAAANGTVLVRAGNALAFSDAVHVQTLVLDDDDLSAGITVQSPSAITSWTLTLPSDDGLANEVLKTDGSGVTDWVAVSEIAPSFWDLRQIGGYYAPAGTGTYATVALTRDIIYAAPFIVSRTTTFDRIGFIKGNNGSANSVGWAALYANSSSSSYYPGALVVQGNIENLAAGGGAALETTINTQLAPGLYWLVFLGGVAAISSIFSLPVTQSGGFSVLPYEFDTTPAPGDRYLGAFTYQASAPDPFPAAIARAATVCAAPLLRVASFP